MLYAFEVNSHSEVMLLSFPWEEKRWFKKKKNKAGKMERGGITEKEEEMQS